MCLQRLFWSREAKPDYDHINKDFLYRPGSLVLEGDSNVYPINPDDVSPKATLFGYPSKIPKMCIDDFVKEIIARKRVVDGVYIQCSGNLSTWAEMKDQNLNMDVMEETMTKLIDLYLGVVAPEKIIVASLPFVYPKLYLREMDSSKSLPQPLQFIAGKARLNDIFQAYNLKLREICTKKKVRFLDIYRILKLTWEREGKHAWWDVCHYNQTTRHRVVVLIKKIWGI